MLPVQEQEAIFISSHITLWNVIKNANPHLTYSSSYLEGKSAKGGFPDSFWESYSAFVKAKAGIEFHPYLLKQYNDCWYLICAADSDGKILNLALDRITNIEPVANKDFIEPDEDFAERFDDIVGVTLIDDKPLEHIVFWVSDISKDYVESKPIHGSQKSISNDGDLRRKYPKLVGGRFFSIDCVPNYELIRELISFGSELLVLSSDDIRNSIIERISNMLKMYHLINPSVL